MTLYHHDAPSSTRISSGQTCRTSYFDSMHDNVSSGSPSGHIDGKSRISNWKIILIVTTCYQEPQPEIFFSYQRPIVPFRNSNMEISGTWQCAIRIWNMEIS